MIQECAGQIRPTALITSSLLESQNRASYSGAMLPKAGLVLCWVPLPLGICAYSIADKAAHLCPGVRAARNSREGIKWDHGAERTWFPGDLSPLCPSKDVSSMTD